MPGRHADHHARLRPLARVHALDEVAEHLLADVEVGDHAVLQRTDRLDVLGRAPDHLLRFDADRERTTVARVDRDDRRLVEHDAAPAHVDERVRGAEVDRHVAAEQSCVEGFAHGVMLFRLAGRAQARSTSPRDSTRPRDAHGSTSPGKNSAISRAADSGPSLPCTRFSVSSIGEIAADRARRGLAGVRRAHQRAHDLPRLGPFDDHRDQRAARDERDEIAEERLAVVLGVVTLRGRVVELAQLERDDLQALALDAADDLADEPALDAVGLAEDERSVSSHEPSSLRPAASSSKTGGYAPGAQREVDRLAGDRRQVDRVRELDAPRPRCAVDRRRPPLGDRASRSRGARRASCRTTRSLRAGHLDVSHSIS